MKCHNCGAEIGDSRVCEFCGTQITPDMLREQELFNKKGCPKCGSTNVTFSREKQGEIKGKGGSAVLRSTVGVCKDCGYTWKTSDGSENVKTRKTWLWVLGWICVFPLPLTILMLRKKDMKPVLKYGIIAVGWLVYLAIAFGGGRSQQETAPADTPAAIEQSDSSEVTAVDEPAPAEPDIPAEYSAALSKAGQYSKAMHMSKAGIYDQLTSEYGENFPAEAAQYAIDNLDADYNANALAKAKSYSDTMHMSKAGIYDQLTSEYGEQFTAEEAQYAINNLQADYKVNALYKARSYRETMSMSNNAIYDQLVSEYGEQFTAEEAQYAIDNLD